ncbi:EboA domain-containing protein [Aliifodinibius salicampi]|uniref:EboA domain-containing protein n=1 Tax=Fodinibius salicampi TaxID=1920655 RepID=A0ABT3PWI7_9BACT|nr:EboA domain-containing protein [Fodinibius salicampi]MCW9712203.1 EboA domain-containing protein [Fodinibius salicampi]
MPDTQTDIQAVRTTILSWLQSRLDEEAMEWIKSTSDKLIDGAEDWVFYSSFSAVPRHTGKENLSLSTKEKAKAKELRTGWSPSHWSIDDLGRTLLTLSIAEEQKDVFFEKLEKTFISSDIGEGIALYQSLPLLPHPNDLTDRAAEGLRTNITSIFNAVAHRNPYPADYLDDDAWNQMVLKALFVETPLYPIQNIDSRANKKLAEMLVDYAHERWAADRDVSPELWRSVGPFADEKIVKNDLKKVLQNSSKLHQQAALLALSDSPVESAKQLVVQHSSKLDQMRQNNIDWDYIGKQFEQDSL